MAAARVPEVAVSAVLASRSPDMWLVVGGEDHFLARISGSLLRTVQMKMPTDQFVNDKKFRRTGTLSSLCESREPQDDI